MDNTVYTTLTRQTGLMREMDMIANNIANAATTGYRQEGIVFSEYVTDVEDGPSLSMARANTRNLSLDQGTLTQTNGTFDLAIEGEGFFLVEANGGQRLTRAGAFAPSAAGDLVTQDGNRVLDAGGAPIFVPPDAGDISVSSDGTLSANGRPLAQVGVVRPLDDTSLVREGSTLFRADSGFEPVEGAKVVQGYLESSNVNPILQIARMIEVQRAYEMGQRFLEREDERVRAAMKTFSGS